MENENTGVFAVDAVTLVAKNNDSAPAPQVAKGEADDEQ